MHINYTIIEQQNVTIKAIFDPPLLSADCVYIFYDISHISESEIEIERCDETLKCIVKCDDLLQFNNLNGTRYKVTIYSPGISKVTHEIIELSI